MVGIAKRWAISLSEPVIMRHGQSLKMKLMDNTVDSDDAHIEEELIMLVGSFGIGDIVQTGRQGSSQAKPSTKRKLNVPTPPTKTIRQKVTMLPAKPWKGKVACLEPLKVSDNKQDLHGLPSTKELLDALACHTMVEHLNGRAMELIRVYKKTKKDLEAVVAREAEPNAKYDGAVVVLDENPVVITLREEAKTLKDQIKEHEADSRRVEVITKVVPYVAMKLYHSDEVGQVIGNLMKAAIFHGRCSALEEIAATKEPVDLSKVKCYRPTSKEEYNEASNAYIT
ncbi:hypothetical protein Tco_0685750 [Tanacetum coccineum]